MIQNKYLGGFGRITKEKGCRSCLLFLNTCVRIDFVNFPSFFFFISLFFLLFGPVFLWGGVRLNCYEKDLCLYGFSILLYFAMEKLEVVMDVRIVKLPTPDVHAYLAYRSFTT